MRQVDIAIIGGGPCGAAACFGLQTVLGPSAKIEIFETEQKLLAVGGMIHITSTNLEHAQNALQDGLHDEFRAVSHVRKNMRLHDQFGNLNRDLLGGEIEVVPWYGIQNLLINKLSQNSVNLGYKLLSLDQLSDGVTLKFENNEQIKAKVVLGADGCRSQTRTLIFDEEPPQYSGQCIWRLQCNGFHPDITEGNNNIFSGEGKTMVIQCTPYDNKEGQFRTYVTGVADWPETLLSELQLDRSGDPRFVVDRFIQHYNDFPSKYLEWIKDNVDSEVSLEQVQYYRDPTALRGIGRVSLMGEAAIVFPTGWRQGRRPSGCPAIRWRTISGPGTRCVRRSRTGRRSRSRPAEAGRRNSRRATRSGRSGGRTRTSCS
eukprot:TRINITY_DN31154_c0_g3_i1.p1 TRINITY_DN31154_c0_g3~~TRINITY_DN31154_c0_g3_i1.p1  ORF type:complete len:373 (+),score=24.60 TRINITY_DN31154_c0_g3_i1:149-1267(+)